MLILKKKWGKKSSLVTSSLSWCLRYAVNKPFYWYVRLVASGWCDLWQDQWILQWYMHPLPTSSAVKHVLCFDTMLYGILSQWVKHFVSPLMVVHVEDLLVEKANSYVEYISILVKWITHCPFQDRRSSMWLTCSLVDCWSPWGTVYQALRCYCQSPYRSLRFSNSLVSVPKNSKHGIFFWVWEHCFLNFQPP